MTTLLDAIATNHTHFFREARHFDFLAEQAPELLARAAAASSRAGARPARPAKSPTRS